MKKERDVKPAGQTRRDFLKVTTASLAAAGVSGPYVLARAAQPEIRVGLTLSYSGVYAMVAKAVESGVRLAFALSPYKDRVRFFTEDTQVKPSVAIQKAEKLFEKERIQMLCGPVAGHESKAVSQFLQPQKRLMLLAYGANIELTGKHCSRYTFLCGHTPWNQSAPAVDWFLNTLGDRVYLIGMDYSTGHEVVRYFRQPFLNKGGKVVGSFFSPIGTSEFAPYLAKVKSAKPEPNGLFGFIAGKDLITFAKQYHEFGLHKDGPPIIVGLGGFGSALLPAFGDAAEGHYHVFHYSPWLDNPENRAFQEAYAKMFNRMGDESALLGFEVGTMMVKGLEAVGGDPNDTEGIIDAVEKLYYRSPRGQIRMDPNHVAHVPIYIFQVQRKAGKLTLQMVADTGHHGTPYGPDGPGGECRMAMG